MPKIVKLPDFVERSRLITATELKTYLGVSDRWVWRWTADTDPEKRIPSYKIGKLRKYKFDEVLWWLDKRKS
jgi:excisionase family DNA binding protein